MESSRTNNGKEDLGKWGLVHTSHFCLVEFNSVKRGKNATLDSDVALVSHLIQN